MGGHLHEFTRDLQIHALHLVQIRKVLIQDIGNNDVADLDLVFGKQHQDQAQRPFKILHLAFVAHDAFQIKIRIFHQR